MSTTPALIMASVTLIITDVYYGICNICVRIRTHIRMKMPNISDITFAILNLYQKKIPQIIAILSNLKKSFTPAVTNRWA